MRVVVFCEARADFEIATELIDRVLREHGEPWIADVLDASPDAVRSWHLDGEGHPFFDVHRLGTYVERLGARVPHGHFAGEPGAAGALMARTGFAIVRRLRQLGAEIDATVLVWDMDDQPRDRRAGLIQARREAESWARFQIVLGLPNAMREAWVLCGFDPETDDETAQLRGLRAELGFQPNIGAHQLDAQDEQAKRSAKRVLDQLTAGDRERERRCWQATPLELLRSRGEPSGLQAFLVEIEQTLLPLVRRT
jgi:hypothetical protein